MISGENVVNSSTVSPLPFTLVGGSVGVLLIHGFTGSPSEMRLVGNYLHQRGLTVAAPLLPGHGTVPADLSKEHWQNWTQHVKMALADLKSKCKTVFVAGISLGSLLTLYLAAETPDLNGVILYSPLVKMPGAIGLYFLPLTKYLAPPAIKKGADDFIDPAAASRLWSYPVISLRAVHEMARLREAVEPLLPQVTCPTLIIYSTIDKWIAPNSAQFTYDHIGSQTKTLFALHKSSHEITLDSEWEVVAERTYQFIQNHLSA